MDRYHPSRGVGVGWSRNYLPGLEHGFRRCWLFRGSQHNLCGSAREVRHDSRKIKSRIHEPSRNWCFDWGNVDCQFVLLGLQSIHHSTYLGCQVARRITKGDSLRRRAKNDHPYHRGYPRDCGLCDCQRPHVVGQSRRGWNEQYPCCWCGR